MADFLDGRPHLLVVGDDHHVDAGPRPTAPLQASGQRVDPLPQPDHLADGGPGEQHHRRRVDKQVVDRAIEPEPPAVGDHVGLGHAGEGFPDGAPEQFEAGALLGAADAGQEVQAAVQLLGVLPDLVRLDAPAGGHRQAQQPTVRVQAAAVHRRKAVGKIASGRVTLSEQDRPWPHSPQRRRCCGNPRCPLVRCDGDQGHGQPEPPVVWDVLA